MNPARLELFRDRHRGERAVIVANGPSLNQTDFSLIRHEICFGLNKIYLGIRKFRFYPRYLVAVNQKVIEQSAEEFRKLNCVRFIGERGAHVMSENAMTYLVPTLNPPARFSPDITHGLHEGWTVTYVALQIAYFMGFRQVVLVGLDHHFEYSGAPNQPRLMAGDDPNHFSPDYFKDQTWDNPDLANSEESYRIARQEYEKAGREIIDATKNGRCTIFKKAELESLFGGAS